MIKLIATDLDGTLLNDKGEIDKKLINILKVLKSKDIKFVPTSGRLYSTLCRNFKDYGSDLIIVAINGAIIQYNNNGKVIYENSIDREICFESVKALIDLNMDIEIYITCKNSNYLLRQNKELIEKFAISDADMAFIENYYDINEDIFKIGIFKTSGFTKEEIDKIKIATDNRFEYAVSGNVWLDITNKEVNKGNAIKILQNIFDIKKEETLVFGDYYNDISMFKRAYYSYAMANAPHDVKAKARFVALDNNSSGVIKVIEKVVGE
ncbi:HAD family hydrolase [Caloramator sp. E03]|uniref:HAD family hydrolase n=1 Tax=Caloramator sp. E03 TaxID=2576307 RepID=UPI00111057BB|nr:Cof-type HAD-IIB family hydrolase [Caloramator sp. E03]QCX32875.1 HAD family hydrolase [Caloramator sp. E03]